MYSSARFAFGKNLSKNSFLDLTLETTIQREQRFVNNLSKFLLVMLGLSLVNELINQILGQAAHPFTFTVSVVSFMMFGASYFFSLRAKTVRLASWSIIIFTNLTITAAVSSADPSLPVAACFLITVMLSLFLLPWWATLLLGLLNTALTFGFYLYPASSPSAPSLSPTTFFVMWFFILMTPTFIGVFLSIQLAQLKRINNFAIEQTIRLKEALSNIESQREIGHNVSQRITSVTAELNTTAFQQTHGSHQQATALTSLTSFFKELAQAINSVVIKVSDIARATEKVLNSTRHVKATTGAAVQKSKRGLEATELTIIANQRMNVGYTQLLEFLVSLQQRSNRIKEVIDLLHSISNQTHLLALNAAIEAAGAGQFGERFGVVAREVKALADRSMRASQDIGDILGQLEVGIKEAVLSAENGQVEAQAAVEVAQESGIVIKELVVAIKQSAEEVENIEQSIFSVSELIEEINRASSQQRTASTQAVETLQGISTIAHQNVSGSAQVTQTAGNLEHLSHELTLALAS